MTCAAFQSITPQWLRGEELHGEPVWCLVHDHLLIRGRVASSVGLALVELRGKIDANSGPALAEVFAELVAGGATSLHVDLSAVDHLDRAGLRTLALTAYALESAGGRFRIRNARTQIEKLLYTTGLGRLLLARDAPRRAVTRSIAQTSAAPANTANMGSAGTR